MQHRNQDELDHKSMFLKDVDLFYKLHVLELSLFVFFGGGAVVLLLFFSKYLADHSNSQINKPYWEHLFLQRLYHNLTRVKKVQTIKAEKSLIQTEHHFLLEK